MFRLKALSLTLAVAGLMLSACGSSNSSSSSSSAAASSSTSAAGAPSTSSSKATLSPIRLSLIADMDFPPGRRLAGDGTTGPGC